MSEHTSNKRDIATPVACSIDNTLLPSLFGSHTDIAQNLLENLREGFFFLSNDTTLLYFNNAAECFLARPRNEVLGKKLADAFPEIQGTKLETLYREALANKETSRFEVYFENSPYRNWYDIRIHPFSQGIAVFFQVTTTQKNTEQEHKETSEQLSLILESLPLAPFSMLADGSLGMTLIGPTIEELTGFSPSQFTEDPGYWLTRIHPDDTPKLHQSLDHLPPKGSVELQFRWKVANGKYKWFAQTLRRVNNNESHHLIGLFYDISDRKKDEAELRYQNILLTAQQETSPDGIIVTNRSMRITSWNKRFATLWNIPDKIIERQDGLAILDYLKPLFLEPENTISQICYLNDHPEEEEIGAELTLHDGRVIERHSRGLFDHHHAYLGRIWFFRDITEKKIAEQRLQELTTTDELTGISNRRHFIRQARHEVERSKRYSLPLSLIMLDIDHFKRINDEHGHDAGDRALRAFADVIQKNLREIDIFGRLGGEEFAIVLPVTTQSGAASAAERIRSAVAKLSIEVQFVTFSFTVSLGVSQLRESGDLDSLLKRADTALYRAKKGGRNQVRIA